MINVTINYRIWQNILKCFTIHKNPNIIKLDLIDSFNSNNYTISNFDEFAQPINFMLKLTEFILDKDTKNDVKLKLNSINYQYGNLSKLLNNEQEIIDLSSPSPQSISSNNMHIDDDISDRVTVMSISDSSSRASAADSYRHIDPALARAVSQSQSNGGPSYSGYLADNTSTYSHPFPCTLFTCNSEDHFSRTAFTEFSAEMQDPKLNVLPPFPKLKYPMDSELLRKDKQNTDLWQILIYLRKIIEQQYGYIDKISSFNFEGFKEHKIMYHHSIILNDSIILNAVSTFLSIPAFFECDKNYVQDLADTDMKSLLRAELRLPEDLRSQFYAHAIEGAVRIIANNDGLEKLNQLNRFVAAVKSKFDLISCLESIPGFEDYNEGTDEIEDVNIAYQDESSSYALNDRITPGVVSDIADLSLGSADRYNSADLFLELPDDRNNIYGLFYYHDSV